MADGELRDLDDERWAAHERRTEALTPAWLDSIVVWWGADGAPRLLAGPGAEPLPGPGPGPVFVLTAQDPFGIRQPPERNHELLVALLRWVRDEGDAPDGAGFAWWPATGSALDGSHFEQGIALRGVDRARAAAVGARFDQLAIYEMTDDHQRVVPCRDPRVTESVPRVAAAGEAPVPALDLVATWWASYRAAFAELGLGLDRIG